MTEATVRVTEVPDPVVRVTAPEAPVVRVTGGGLVGPPGPPSTVPGPIGPQGPPGPVGNASFRHIQIVADTVWNIVHDLGFYPNVTVVDSAGTEVIGEVHYDSMTELTLTFSAALGGEAYLS